MKVKIFFGVNLLLTKTETQTLQTTGFCFYRNYLKKSQRLITKGHAIDQQVIFKEKIKNNDLKMYL